MGTSWGINETTALRIIRKVEDILVKSGLFNLPGKKAVQTNDLDIEVVVVDIAEHKIEKPKKSECVIGGSPGNERRTQDNKSNITVANRNIIHSLKSQVLANAKTREILCTAHSKGKIHDFKIWKTSQIGISPKIECLADKGYQGIHKIHPNSRIPYKKKPRQQLELEQKKFNRQLASERVVIENIHRSLKIFRILSSRYRNRRRRFGLRFNLIAGIYNYELFVKSNHAIA